MQVTLIIPDEHAAVVIETYARAKGWRSTALDGDVGAFARKQLVESIMNTLRDKRGDDAAAVARSAAIAEVNQAVKIT